MSGAKWFACLAVAVAVTGSVAAFAEPRTDGDLEKTIEAARARAFRLADRGRWEAAFAVLDGARESVRRAARRATAAPADPGREREARALRDWYLAQQQRVRRGQADPARVMAEYRARAASLERKATGAAMVARQRTLRLPYDLQLARLEEIEAQLHERRSTPEEALACRKRALLIRLRAYTGAGRRKDAGTAAERLLALAPADPDACEAAATFYQETGRFERASALWRRAIRALEGPAPPGSGPAPAIPGGVDAAARRTRLSRCYRELAFCCQKLGRTAEMKSHLDRAARLDGPRAAPRP